MADWTQTITNNLAFLGIGPPTKWNEFNWGEGNWGDGTEDLVTEVGKLISNSQPSTTAVQLFVGYGIVISESIAPTFEMSEETLTDGSGYNYVFRRPSTDAEDRTLPTWTEVDDGTVTWACQAAASTTWSEA